MALIFSHVEAQVNIDLISKFPNEFVFDTTLRKVCVEADIVIEDFPYQEGRMSQQYKLMGCWPGMERVYQQMVAMLELYNTCVEDTMGAKTGVDSNDIAEILDYSLSALGEKVADDDKEKDIPLCPTSPMANAVIEDCKPKTSRRRPRKSALQSRRFISRVASKENLEEESGHYDLPDLNTDGDNQTVKMLNPVGLLDGFAGKENNSDVTYDEEKDGLLKKYQDVLSEESVGDKKEQPVSKRKRGRPKKQKPDSVFQCRCSPCTFVAKDKTKLQSHVSRMHKSSPSSCDICHKVFPNRRYMLKHKASHRGPQHCCDVCGKMYKIKRAMIEHRKTHDSSYQRPSFKCNQCPKSFCNQYILSCHIRDIHKGLKKFFLCSICGKSFTTKRSLMEHSNAHNGVKPYACTLCGKTFSYETALRDHRFCHLDSKQFSCRHCQKSFSQRSGLKMHMRTHRLHKMFTCSECGRGFTQKQALQRHERVHKGEKPYICKHCGRLFTDASIIRRHLILVHKIEKARNVWREDIVCTIVADPEHHVQKVSDEDDVAKLELEKQEVLNRLGLKSKPESARKGPSKAFQRYYPPRVVLLDSEDNVIEEPEIVQTSLPSSGISSKVTTSVACPGSSLLQFAPQSGTTLIEVSEAGLEVESNSQVQVLNQSQWDVFTSQLNKVSNTNQIEHIILEDPNHPAEVTRNLEETQKLIKCENTPHTVLVETSGPQGELVQASPNPTLSPVSFNPVVLSGTSKSVDNPFEALAAHLNQATGQYFDIRVSNHSTPMPWSSMYYYSHLISQLGIGINPDLPSFPNTAGSSSSFVTASLAPANGVELNQTPSTSLLVDRCIQEVPNIQSNDVQTLPSSLPSNSSSTDTHNAPKDSPHPLAPNQPSDLDKTVIVDSDSPTGVDSIVLNVVEDLSSVATNHSSSSDAISSTT